MKVNIKANLILGSPLGMLAARQKSLEAHEIDNSKGAKHKQKEKDKSEKKGEGHSQDSDDGKDHKKDKGSSKKKKKSKEEKKKNEDGIKKPLSAYMLYTNHRRPVIKSEHPGILFLIH